MHIVEEDRVSFNSVREIHYVHYVVMSKATCVYRLELRLNKN